MRHVAYEWVMSHMNESCHIKYMYWKSANEFEWNMAHIEGVMSHMNESCPIWVSHVTSNTCTRRVYYKSANESECVTSRTKGVCPIWLYHSFIWSHMTKSLPTWMSQVPQNICTAAFLKTHAQYLKTHAQYLKTHAQFWKHMHNNAVTSFVGLSAPEKKRYSMMVFCPCT